MGIKGFKFENEFMDHITILHLSTFSILKGFSDFDDAENAYYMFLRGRKYNI
jgi:hypothetical protein